MTMPDTGAHREIMIRVAHGRASVARACAGHHRHHYGSIGHRRRASTAQEILVSVEARGQLPAISMEWLRQEHQGRSGIEHTGTSVMMVKFGPINRKSVVKIRGTASTSPHGHASKASWLLMNRRSQVCTHGRPGLAQLELEAEYRREPVGRRKPGAGQLVLGDLRGDVSQRLHHHPEDHEPVASDLCCRHQVHMAGREARFASPSFDERGRSMPNTGLCHGRRLAKTCHPQTNHGLFFFLLFSFSFVQA